MPSFSLGVDAAPTRRRARASSAGSAGKDSSRIAFSHRMNESHAGSVVTTTWGARSEDGTMLGSEGMAATSSRENSCTFQAAPAAFRVPVVARTRGSTSRCSSFACGATSTQRMWSMCLPTAANPCSEK